MATDKLGQLGKKVGKFQKETRQTSHYVSENLASIEESIDLLGPLYTYRLEFKVYGGGSAKLNIKIYDTFRRL